MIRNAPDMKVRLSADMRQKIESAAGRNNRTMNSEIVARLEQSFREEGVAVSPLPFADHEERLAKLEQVIIAMLTDFRLDKLATRVSELEKRLSEQFG
jgi:Arc-like DNA binding domain